MQQRTLLNADWPAALMSLPLARRVFDKSAGGDGGLIYAGLTVGFGMSVGSISNSLERGCANYLGRKLTINPPPPPPNQISVHYKKKLKVKHVVNQEA